MNNFEKIKNMTLDEMAEFASIFQRCSFCSLAKRSAKSTEVLDVEKCRKISCKEGVKQWLQAESEG